MCLLPENKTVILLLKPKDEPLLYVCVLFIIILMIYMNFDVATRKRSILRKEKIWFWKNVCRAYSKREATQTIFGYSVQNEVFAVHKILYNLRITVFKSDWSRKYPM